MVRKTNIFNKRYFKKIVLISAILSKQDLVEECGLSRRHIHSIHDSLVKKLNKQIDEFYEDQKNEEESNIEFLLNKKKWKKVLDPFFKM